MPFITSADSWNHIDFEHNAGKIIKCLKNTPVLYKHKKYIAITYI